MVVVVRYGFCRGNDVPRGHKGYRQEIPASGPATPASLFEDVACQAPGPVLVLAERDQLVTAAVAGELGVELDVGVGAGRELLGAGGRVAAHQGPASRRSRPQGWALGG